MNPVAQKPATEYCLDLRELIDLDGFAQDPAAILLALLDAPSFSECRRLYVGSSFCPQSLFHSRFFLDSVLGLCRKRSFRATLSVPIPAQRFLERQSAFVENLLAEYCDVIDEVVVNDLGTLARLSTLIHNAEEASPYSGLGLVIGRLLNKDARDPRCDELSFARRMPNILQPGYGAQSMLRRMIATSSFWSEEHERYENALVGVEFDSVCEQLDLTQLPQGLLPALNANLCYMSTGQICEFASIGLAAQASFRPNAACAGQCAKTCVAYTGASGVEFFKLGRSIFFEPRWQTELLGATSQRCIVSVLKEVLC